MVSIICSMHSDNRRGYSLMRGKGARGRGVKSWLPLGNPARVGGLA